MKLARRLKNISITRQVSSVISHEDINAEKIMQQNNGRNAQAQVWEDALPYKEIPGPQAIPLLGNSWRFLPFIGDYEIEHIDKVAKRLHEKYGRVVKVEGLIGRPDMVFLFDPGNIEKAFRQEDLLPMRPSMPSLNYYKHVYRKDFFGDNGGVIAVHGEGWQIFRSKVNQIMMQPRIAKMYVKPIENTAMEFVKRIRQIRDDNLEMPEDFLNELHKWSLESIAQVALDVRLGCFENKKEADTQRLIDAINTFFINVPVLELKAPIWRLFPTPTFKKYIQALDDIKNLSMKYINKAILDAKNKKGGEPSVLQRVLALDQNKKIASILALDMFLVGVDTTSNAAASILYQLALHQDKQEILYQEIKNCLSPGCDLDSAKLESMSYLKACIKETMRMRPVVIGNGRQTTKNCVIGGYKIPKGVQLIFQHYVISNLEEYFPKADEFIPERWLKCPISSQDVISTNHHPFASLPFGFGRRMCLGRRFAELELQTLITKVIENYKVEYHHESLDYHIHPMYTPNGPLKLRFIDRNQP